MSPAPEVLSFVLKPAMNQSSTATAVFSAIIGKILGALLFALPLALLSLGTATLSNAAGGPGQELQKPALNSDALRSLLSEATTGKASAKEDLRKMLEAKALYPIDFKDSALARDYYEYGARLGIPSAMHFLANHFCSDSITARKDLAQCEYWHLEAARRGYVPAMISLYAQYRYGEKKDSAQALMWLHRAAEAGDGDAMLSLARRYDTGDEVDRDPVLAQQWYARAEAAGIETPAVFKRKNAELVAKLKADAATGDVNAMFRLARAYYLGGFYGLSLEKDLRESARWYLEAAKRGDVVAANNLASMYGLGEGVDKDPAKASQWYQFSAEKGYVKAQVNLGGMYQRGEGTPVDDARAHAWFRLALEHLNADPKTWSIDPREVAQLARRTCALGRAFSAMDRDAADQYFADIAGRIKSPIPAGQRLSASASFRQMCSGG